MSSNGSVVQPAHVCVLGLGYIGLPTASMFATHGLRVTGVDPSPRVQAALTPRTDGSLRLHLEEPDIEEHVSKALASGRLEVRATPVEADVFVIAVPTPFIEETHGADLTYVRQAAESIVPFLRSGNLVILESTVPPGTTRDVLAPLLERSGLMAGQDVAVAHCPERVLPGRILTEFVENDRLAGGLTPACAEEAARLYETFVRGQVIRTDATSAEMAKLVENTFRDVNVALANEFARIAEHIGVDAHHVIALANRHPRVNVLKPGPGVGGHCIAVDPWFLVEAAPDQAHLIRTARLVNDAMPYHVADRIADLAGRAGARLALLGITYKADVDDVRESPALDVARRLVERGYDVRLCDPHVPESQAGLPAPLVSLSDATRDAAVVVLLVDHAEFARIDPAKIALSLQPPPRAFDARSFLDRARWQAAGFQVEVLGVAGQPDLVALA